MFYLAGGVIEMSEFSLFIRNQAKEAERKLKVCITFVYNICICRHFFIEMFLSWGTGRHEKLQTLKILLMPL